MSDAPINIPANMIVPRTGPEAEARREALAELAADPTAMIRALYNTCPRCGGDVPNTEHKGEYPGAMSRTDNRTEVCSQCGRDEAFEQIPGGPGLTPQDQWPVPLRRVPDWQASRGFSNSAMAPRPMPHELPELRLHLLERWVPGGVLENVARMAVAAGDLSGAPEFFAAHEKAALATADLWWVKGDMAKLVEAAMPSIPADVTAGEIEMPCEAGLVVLEHPFIGSSATSGDNIRVDAVMWAPLKQRNGEDAIAISAYQYLDFAAGLGADELGSAVKSGLIFQARQDIMTSADGTVSARLRGGAWAFLGRTDWLLNQRLDNFDHLDPAKFNITDDRLASQEEDRRWLAAFIVLVTHKLMTDQDTVYAGRATRRRAERVGVKAPNNVRIIRLREAIRARRDDETDGDEHHHVEWSHRWIQKGHMGWRRCGPGRTQKRLVYVRPGIKGPEDKPLIVKDTVQAWVK